MSTVQTILVELYLNGAWVDITSYVRVDEQIRIRHGISRESGTADPAECYLKVNNDDGRFTPSNPTGPYYGYLKRNTPLRVKVDTVVRFSGEVSEFPTTWDEAGSDVAVRMVGSGVLRRLGRGAIKSPMTRAVVNIAKTRPVIGYWPMEEPDGATLFASALPGGNDMTFTGAPDMATFDPGIGSDALPTINGAVLTTSVAAAGTDEFTFGFYLSIPTAGTASGARLVMLRGGGGTGLSAWWILYEAGGGIRLQAGTELSPGTYAIWVNQLMAFALDGEIHYHKLEVSTSGGTTTWSYSVYGRTTISNTWPLPAACPTQVVLNPYSEITTEIGIGQVILGSTDTAIYVTEFDQGLSAYAGETVVARLNRLAGYVPVNMSILTGSVTPAEMGAETSKQVLALMRAAEAADAGGILYDTITVLGLSYTTRWRRYSDSNPSALTLDYDAKQLTPPVSPTDDDQLLTNDVTVTRTAGVTARQYLASGPLSIQAYPAGVGPYETAQTLDLYTDTQPMHVAGWLLNVGTVDGLRYPQLTVDLLEQSALVAAIVNLRPGDRITLVDLPLWLGPEDPELHVLGWTEVIGTHTRTITLNLTPAQAWRVYQIENQTYGRLDSTTTVTNEPLDATETGVDYTGDTWITTATRPGDFPFDIVIGGEVMRVTAATASTFTVTRSMNGVVKTHATSAPIRLAQPVHLAL